MQTITLPVWALVASAGMPTICLIWIITALIRRRRKAARASVPTMAADQVSTPMISQGDFRQDLLAQQIDIVFKGLTALIETERVKLNALLNQNFYADHFQKPAPMTNLAPQAGEIVEPTGTGEAASPVGRKVAEAIAAGQGMDNVAAQLGLSQAEVALAMKLNNSQAETPHRKLEAVA